MYDKIAKILVLIVLSSSRMALGTNLDDPYSAIWSTDVQSLTTMEARFSVLNNLSAKTSEYYVRVDRGEGLFYGKQLFVSQDINGPITYEDEYGYNGSVAWKSTASTNGKVKRFDYENPTENLMPLEMRRGQIQIPLLEEVLLPLHLSKDLRSNLLVEYSSDASTPPAHTGKSTLTYFLKDKSDSAGSLAGTIVYLVDFTDGVRIFETKVYRRQDGSKDLLGYQVYNEAFTKSKSGVWFPGVSTRTAYDPEGAVSEKSTLRILEFDVNIPLGKEDFSPAPKIGDFIWDSIANAHYNYGSAPGFSPENVALKNDGIVSTLPLQGSEKGNRTKEAALVPEFSPEINSSKNSSIKFVMYLGGALLLSLILFLGLRLAKNQNASHGR